MNNNHVISLKKIQPTQEPPKIPEQREVPKKKSHTQSYIVLGCIFVAACAGGFVVFRAGIMPYFTVASSTSSSVTIQKDSDLVAEVSKLILLPEDEVPTIATVNNPAKYADQVFFKNTKVGDKVLIYIEAKKAYLYRPSAHLLIEVAPITPESR